MRVMSALAAILLAFAATSGSAVASDPSSGATVLTVIGDITKFNRAGLDGFRDTYFRHLDKDFPSAFEFDGAILGKIGRETITSQAEGWPKPVSAAGPRLAEVMAAAGVPEAATLKITALDGYEIELSAAERREQNWILATHADGRPLGVGGRGPLWLMHDTSEAPISKEAESKWVYSIFLIEAVSKPEK